MELEERRGKGGGVDADSGEALPSRKVRGSKAGGAIELVKVGVTATPLRLVIGEGVETVLTGWLGMLRCHVVIARTEFWSFVDLGNIGGAPPERRGHPTPNHAGG